MDRLSLGTQMLTVRHPDYQQVAKAVLLSVDKPGEVHLVLIPLPGMISGTVIDHLGRGLEGVRVFYAAGMETTTEPNGNYEFTGVPVGGYTVTAEYASFKTESRPVNVESKTRAVISFALTPTTGTINGTITDHQGKILGGVFVSAGGKATRSRDSDGVYELTGIPVGKHTILVGHTGFQTQRRPVTVEGGKSTSSPFTLIPTTGKISGNVKGANNVLLTGVTVSAGGRKTTTRKGQFVLASVPVGDVTVTLSHPSYVKRKLQLKLNGGETKVLNETLSLLPGNVKGTVKRISSQKGRTRLSSVKGAKVTLGNRSTTTDASGVFRFSDVPAGSYKVNVTHPGCTAIDAPKDVVVLGGGQKESSVKLTLNCSVPKPKPKPKPKAKRKALKPKSRSK